MPTPPEERGNKNVSKSYLGKKAEAGTTTADGVQIIA